MEAENGLDFAASYTISAKIVVLGDQSVGKSSFVIGFDRNLNPELPVPTLSPTVGASLVTRNVTIEKKTVRMQIWDTAGQERFRAMAPLYYRKANAAIILYDVCDRNSFEASKSWVSELKGKIEAPVLILLVGNKIDLSEERVVSNETGEKYARSVGALFCETSALMYKGVNEAFSLLAENLIKYEEKYSNFEYKLNCDHVKLEKPLPCGTEDQLHCNLC